MHKRLLSLFLSLALLLTGLPAALAMEAVIDEVAVDEPISQDAAEASDDSASSDGTSDDSASDSIYRTLVRGDRDSDDSADIVILQNRLIELGYLRDAADGVFGENTELAVAALQRSNGLEETGTATPELQELLYSGAALVSAADSMDPESVTYRVQEKLALWGFLADEPDGVAGSKTNEAVELFKTYLRDYLKRYPTPAPEATATPAPTEATGFADGAIAVDLPIDPSEAGEITQEVLDFVDGNYTFEIYQQTLSNGDTGDEVMRLQRRLYQLKYLAVVDGEYGASTERALLYFQKKNGLSQTAVADEATQRVLYSEEAVESEEFVNQYKLVVDVSDQRVYVYQWDGSSYGTCIGEMICSTGLKSTPTPLGTYQAAGPTGTGEWYWFQEYQCYAKWGYRIIGGILFHSVIYSRGKVLNRTSVQKLGRPASHGCIRLKVEHAQWIYENCPAGTTVVVQE